MGGSSNGMGTRPRPRPATTSPARRHDD
jgi:hypothetical protein